MAGNNYQKNIDHFEFNSKVSTKYLSHFTPKFENLLKIIDSGFRPSECDEYEIYKKDYIEINALKNWYSDLNGEEDKVESYKKKIPMVCFCDIPYTNASQHRRKYGLYSIALKKEWGIAQGLSPIIYLPKDSKVHVILKNLYCLRNRLIRVTEEYEIPDAILINQQLEILFEFIKPYINEKRDYKFYDEREWRYIPPAFIEYSMDDTSQYLNFKKEDFLFAVVRTSKEKNQLLEALRNKYGYISSKRIKIKKK